MSNAPRMREYAFERMNHLLTTLAFQVQRAVKVPGPEEIHDVRVSTRRFSQGLLLFGEFFPSWEVKKIQRRLKLRKPSFAPRLNRVGSLFFTLVLVKQLKI